MKSGNGWIFDTETGKLTITEELGLNPFAGIADKVRVIDTVPGAFILNGKQLFAGMHDLSDADLSNLGVSACGDMEGMFDCCYSLRSLDLSSWDIYSVENMRGMFSNCRSLENIQMGDKWQPKNVEDISSMFSGCKALKEMDLRWVDVRNVDGLDHMFEGCSSLKTLDLSGWDTYHIEDMRFAFAGCTGLETLDLTGWRVRDDVKTESMFYQVPQTARVLIDAKSVAQKLPEGVTFEYDDAAAQKRKDWVKDQYIRGNQYYYGTDVEQDYDYAAEHYLKALKYEDELTEDVKEELTWKLERIGKWYLDYVTDDPEIDLSFEEAEECFEWEVRLGGPDKAVEISQMYENKTEYPAYKAIALKWLEKAAGLGSAIGQYNLGVHYLHGDGVSQNKAHARYLFEKAAAQDFPDAQFWLGTMYYNGSGGLDRDLTKAKELVQKAADQGFEEAKEMLAGNWF